MLKKFLYSDKAFYVPFDGFLICICVVDEAYILSTVKRSTTTQWELDNNQRW